MSHVLVDTDVDAAILKGQLPANLAGGLAGQHAPEPGVGVDFAPHGCGLEAARENDDALLHRP